MLLLSKYKAKKLVMFFELVSQRFLGKRHLGGIDSEPGEIVCHVCTQIQKVAIPL